MPLSPAVTPPYVRCEPALSLPDKPCWFFNYLSSGEGIQLPFSLKNMPKDTAGLLWLGTNSCCTNLFLIYEVQPNRQGCFYSLIECDRTEGRYPFYLGILLGS